MTSEPPDLGINRRGTRRRVHLHYEGGSWIENRSAASEGDTEQLRIEGVDLAVAADRSRPSSSWVDIHPGLLKDPEAVLADVLGSTPWAQGETWRYERYVEEQRLGAMIRDRDQSEVLRQTGLHLRALYASPLRGVAAILYRDGKDFQGLHADRSMKWLDNTLIAILVVGERRPFLLRPRRHISKAERIRSHDLGTDAAEDVRLHPGHGDLIVLGGRCQRDWLHGVPVCDVRAERISLTWRWSSRTGEPDPGPVYGEGVHFSDAASRPFRRTRRVGGR